MQSHPLPMHILEVRVHPRTKMWFLASTIKSLLSVFLLQELCLASCPPFWPQTVWTQDTSFDLMPWWFLVISSTTTERLGSLHPQDWEPTIPLHTHSGCVMYNLYFPLFLHVEGYGMHMPLGELEIPFDPQHRTGSQHFVFSPGYPRCESHFASTPVQLPPEGKPRRSWLGGSARTLWGSRICSFVYQANWEQRRWRMRPFAIRNVRRGRTSFPTILTSHGHYKPD